MRCCINHRTSYARANNLPARSGVRDWEIIVVDDNSPDGTLEVAEELQRVYGADRVVRITFSVDKIHSPLNGDCETVSRGENTKYYPALPLTASILSLSLFRVLDSFFCRC